MKYIIIILFSFILVAPVYAAKQVQGEVPKVEPLQMPAAGVAPNINRNIQFVDPSRAGRVEPGQSGIVDKTLNESAPGEVASGATTPKSGRSVWWLIMIVVLGGTGLWRWGKSKA